MTIHRKNMYVKYYVNITKIFFNYEQYLFSLFFIKSGHKSSLSREYQRKGPLRQIFKKIIQEEYDLKFKLA